METAEIDELGAPPIVAAIVVDAFGFLEIRYFDGLGVTLGLEFEGATLKPDVADRIAELMREPAGRCWGYFRRCYDANASMKPSTPHELIDAMAAAFPAADRRSR